MTHEELNAIRERAKNATKGPWKYNETSFELDEIVDMDGETIFDIGTYTENDAEFIANAREDIPALIAEVERLRESLQVIANSDVWFIEPNARVSSHDQAYDYCVMEACNALGGDYIGEEIR